MLTPREYTIYSWVWIGFALVSLISMFVTEDTRFSVPLYGSIIMSKLQMMHAHIARQKGQP